MVEDDVIAIYHVSTAEHFDPLRELSDLFWLGRECHHVAEVAPPATGAHVTRRLEVRCRFELRVPHEIGESGSAVGGKIGARVDQGGCLVNLGVELEELCELFGGANGDEQRPLDARRSQLRKLLGPLQAVVPAKGSSQMSEEDDNCAALVADDGGGAGEATARVEKLHAPQRLPRDQHVIHVDAGGKRTLLLLAVHARGRLHEGERRRQHGTWRDGWSGRVASSHGSRDETARRTCQRTQTQRSQ